MTTAMLDERYGRKTKTGGPRVWLIVAISLGVLAVAGLSWMTLRSSMYSVSVDQLGFSTPDEHTATVSFQFSSTPGTDVTCAISAQDTDFGVVGYRVIRFPGTESHVGKTTETIRTVGLATTANVEGCWVS